MIFSKEQKVKDRWVVSPVNELRVLAVPDAPICCTALPAYPDILDNIRIAAASKEDILRAMESTKLLLSFTDEKEHVVRTLPIRKCAFETLLSRACIGGTNLKRLAPDKVAQILNWCLETNKKRGNILIREGYVYSVHSADEYKILPQYDLLQSMDRYLMNRFGAYHILEAAVSDKKTVVRIMLDKDRTLLRKVKLALRRRGRTIADAVPVLLFTTSDTTSCGANLSPYIQEKDGCNIRIGRPLYLRHGRDNTVNDFKDNLSKVFKMFEDSADDMVRLMKMEIVYPENCFRLLASRAELPAKAVEKYIVTEFVPGVRYTGYDLYFMLWHIVPLMKDRDIRQKIHVEENISRLLLLNFARFDQPALEEVVA